MCTLRSYYALLIVKVANLDLMVLLIGDFIEIIVIAISLLNIEAEDEIGDGVSLIKKWGGRN